MRRDLTIILSIFLACFMFLGCSDEGSTDTADTAGGADTAVADTGADVSSEPEMGVADTATEEDMGTEEDTDEPRGTCGHVPAQDESALYDLVTPLQKFVGQANVSRSGASVSVNIIDETDEFVGDFDEEFGNCIVVDVETLTADLCFYNADGTAAEDSALGANLFGFIHGAPHTNPSATLIGAARQGVDRSCSPGGWYVLDFAAALDITGDLPTEVTDFVQTEYLDYLGIFDLGADRFSSVIGVEEPVEELMRDGDPLAGEIDILVRTGFALTIADVETDFDIDYELVGTADFAANTISGTVTLTIESDDNAGVVSGDFVATRP